MRACIEPSHTSPHDDHSELTLLQAPLLNIRNLKFAMPGRLEAAGNIDYLIIVEIKPSNSKTGFRRFGLLFDRQRLSFLVKFNDAVSLRIIDGVREYSSTKRLVARSREIIDQVTSVKYVIAQD